jgi:hypothetical protein
VGNFVRAGKIFFQSAFSGFLQDDHVPCPAIKQTQQISQLRYRQFAPEL